MYLFESLEYVMHLLRAIFWLRLVCQEDEIRVMTSKPAFEICKSPENEGKFSNKYGNLLNCMYVCMYASRSNSFARTYSRGKVLNLVVLHSNIQMLDCPVHLIMWPILFDFVWLEFQMTTKFLGSRNSLAMLCNAMLMLCNANPNANALQC